MEKWELNGSTLHFDELTHSYWYDDTPCISVTQLLKLKFPCKYEGVNQKVLNDAAIKGNGVHQAIEMFEKFNIDDEELQELRDYKFLKKMFKFEVLENEIPIVLKYKDLVLVGRLDLVITENGELGLADIKCTSTLDKEYLAYQLNLYKLGYEQTYNKEIKFLRGIHIKNGKRKYVQIPINEVATKKLLNEYLEEKNGN